MRVVFVRQVQVDELSPLFLLLVASSVQSDIRGTYALSLRGGGSGSSWDDGPYDLINALSTLKQSIYQASAVVLEIGFSRAQSNHVFQANETFVLDSCHSTFHHLPKALGLFRSFRTTLE